MRAGFVRMISLPITTKRLNRSTGPILSRSLNRNLVSFYDSLYLVGTATLTGERGHGLLESSHLPQMELSVVVQAMRKE
jgi:hypothetical protein